MDCAFCAIARGEGDATVVYEDDETVAFLDRRPLFPGHTLVIPRRHIETLPELPDPVLVPLFSAVRLMSAAIPAATGAQGTFVAVNNKVSQSVPHLHVHVVPRTKGDGLKGFFWPRHAYEDRAQEEEVAVAIREAAARLRKEGHR